ncbi:hypothetical protein EMCG_07062 [[Emmonsia] crescens]|uniref:Uncharacterized protein n=1 Tax=[Emmonsia] crescens TaxID=73230 RepID=A0A0G2I9D2_9EURO|nr:hypothetical protein EMCG_07062 [Emmonsia crescens UAMH 3008]
MSERWRRLLNPAHKTAITAGQPPQSSQDTNVLTLVAHLIGLGLELAAVPDSQAGRVTEFEPQGEVRVEPWDNWANVGDS